MKNTKKSKRTVLSSMEEIVNQAKIHGLDPEFYQNAENSLDFVSRKLSLSKEEAMLLSFFVEESSDSRIYLTSIARMLGVSNIRIISMMNFADRLIRKGYLSGSDNGRDGFT